MHGQPDDADELFVRDEAGPWDARAEGELHGQKQRLDADGRAYAGCELTAPAAAWPDGDAGGPGIPREKS